MDIYNDLNIHIIKNINTGYVNLIITSCKVDNTLSVIYLVK